MVEFRQHLLGVFDQVCLDLNRKIGSFEQFTKFVKTRAQLTSDYAKSLEKLASKSSSSSFCEENGISSILDNLFAEEAKQAKYHADLAECLHDRILQELIFTRDTLDKLRKTIESDGQTARKQYHDALLAMKRAKDTYMKTSRELEMNEWFQKDEAATATPQAQQKREKKVLKLRQDLQDAQVAYRLSVDEATRIQNEFFQKRLPSMLDSLQRVFRQRASKIHDAIRDYSIQCQSTLSECLPVVQELQKVVEAFNIQSELEQYVTNTESFFTIPQDPQFEKFVRTPEGQVPPSVIAQQKTLYNKFHSALRGADKKTPAAGESESTSDVVKSSAASGIFGKDVALLMEEQKSQYPRLQVPYILVFLADSIIRQDGQHSDGIFRLSGSLPTMDKVKARLNAGEYVDPPDVHDASGLFKFFLRSLPNPLVPTDLYEAAINESPNAHDVFMKIPEPNRTIAGFVVRFIHDYFLPPEIIEVTLMTPDNLSTVLFPCIIRNPSSDLMEIMRHVEVEKAWMRKCFTSLDVSGFPSLDQCREQAGLTGKTPKPLNAESAPTVAVESAPQPAADISMAKPTNPPPKPEVESLPEKPTGVAPLAPPTSLPTAAMNLGVNPGIAPAVDGSAPLVLDFSSLNFSDAGASMNLSSTDDNGSVSTFLNGTQPTTIDFSTIPSFNFSSAPDMGSGMTAPDLGSGMTAPPPMLPASINLTLPPNVIEQSQSPGNQPQ